MRALLWATAIGLVIIFFFGSQIHYLTEYLTTNQFVILVSTWFWWLSEISLQIFFAVVVLVIAMVIFRRLTQRSEMVKVIPRKNADKTKTSIFSKTKEIPKPTVRFKDVAGVDEAKEELIEVVEFLKNPQKFGRLGGRIPKGVLLVGPPGVGKPLLAKAVAGEADKPFYYYTGSDFVEQYVGVGASRARSLFLEAEKNAPCIVFIDEIDALGKRTLSASTGGDREYDQTINSFLSEMDGFEANRGIMIIGATNRQDNLDDAFLRPGRFDRIVQVNPPDIKGREDILKVHTRPPVILSSSVNLKNIAKITAGFSGADLANLVNEAAINAVKKDKNAIETNDFEEAKEKIRLGKENKSLASVLSEEEKWITAVHESGHGIIASVLPGADPLYKISIIPRGKALGITAQTQERDKYNLKKSYLEELICILLGGRAAEEIILGEKEITAGAQNDFERATEIAIHMVCEFGMSKLGPVNYRVEFGFNNSGIVSEQTKRDIGSTIKEILENAYQKVKEIIDKNKPKVLKIAKALMEKETLEREEIETLIKES